MKKLFSLFLVLFFAGTLYADITPLPDPPQRTDPSTFSEKADAFLGALPDFGTEANALAVEVSGYKDDAASSATSANLSSESAESTANFSGIWSTLTGALTFPASVYHSSQYWQLTESITDVTAEVPGTSDKWISSQSGDLFFKFDTIADLKAITYTPEDGQEIEVLGYYTVGDGGIGQFYWDSTSIDTDNNGTILKATAITVGRFKRLYSGAVDVKWFGARNGTAYDSTTALQAVLDFAVTERVAVYVSPGTYKTTSTLGIIQNTIAGNAWGVTVYGDNTNWNNVSVIYAEHTGAAIINLKGSNGSNISGLKLVSDSTTYPKTGLTLGRDVNVDSCGWHNIQKIWISGMFSEAGIYSIASEENIWSDIFVYLEGGGALYGFYTGISDVLAVDSLPTSSNLANSVTKLNIWNLVNDPATAGVYIEGSEAVGSWSFKDCYVIPKSGNYYQINNGAIDGLACLGPFTFDGCGGEIYTPVSPWLDTPTSGFRISSVANLDVYGLTITGARCQLINAAGTRKLIDVDSNLTLVNPNIIIPPLDDSTITYTMIRNKIEGGIFSVGTSDAWIPLTFSGAWADSLGSPYAQAAYCVDAIGILRLRGRVTNGSTGVSPMFVLDPGYEPIYSMFFDIQDGGVNGKILVDAGTGQVNLNVGTGGDVDLSGVSFKLVE